MKIAIIGSGCSGLAATWALNRYSDHQVDLYEADTRPGGHAHSVKFTNPRNGKEAMVDTFSITAYPNFTRLLRLLNVNVLDTSMSWSVTRNEGEFEWASNGLHALFSQPTNLFNSRLWRMLWDIVRFNASVRRFIMAYEASGTVNDMSIGEYLDSHGYSDAFRDEYLLPLTAAIWSTSPNICANDYTMQSVLRYLHNHHMLQIFGKPVWQTIAGGSHHYVHQITSNLPPEALKLGTRVSSVAPINVEGKRMIVVTTESGVSEVYDHVIMACQSYASHEILKKGGSITPDEERILGGFSWTKNEAVLHADESYMPRNHAAWSAWNYFTRGGPNTLDDTVTVTSSMNVLQHLDISHYGPIFSTLNPSRPLCEELVQARIEYAHPTFNAKALALQRDMPSIQNKRGISFAGAWMGYAFHEDGVTAGLEAAVALGVRLPFELAHSDRRVRHAWLAEVFDVLELIRRLLLTLFFAFYWSFGSQSVTVAHSSQRKAT